MSLDFSKHVEPDRLFGCLQKLYGQQLMGHSCVERLSKDDVQKMQWEVLEAKIGNWIHYMRIAVRKKGFDSLRTQCFAEVTANSVAMLLSFGEAIALQKSFTEKVDEACCVGCSGWDCSDSFALGRLGGGGKTSSYEVEGHMFGPLLGLTTGIPPILRPSLHQVNFYVIKHGPGRNADFVQNLGGICFKCWYADSLTFCISSIALSHSCGWRTQNLWSTPGSNSSSAGTSTTAIAIGNIWSFGSLPIVANNCLPHGVFRKQPSKPMMGLHSMLLFFHASRQMYNLSNCGGPSVPSSAVVLLSAGTASCIAASVIAALGTSTVATLGTSTACDSVTSTSNNPWLNNPSSSSLSLNLIFNALSSLSY
ncbi:exocyst complex component EXO70A1 [Senna tora]|uniref:Exocyst complex component EXO70A1 n=1 Tax=Senna tora TaxID=362788 RepID=A0A834SPR0_9FABA|nr:exocyst complex component EXO70A1 [Senna tora]